MRRNCCNYHTACAIAIAFIIGFCFSVLAETNATSSNMPEEINSRLAKLPYSGRADLKTQQVKDVLAGVETQAVAVAFSRHTDAGVQILDPNWDIDSVILHAFEKETLKELVKLDARKGFSVQIQHMILGWAWGVQSKDLLIWLVDHTIDSNVVEQWDIEKYRGESEMDIQGPPCRPCDTAFDLVHQEVDGAQIVLGRVPISELDDIAVRDEKLKLLKTWWKENKDFLEWSDKQNKFIINKGTNTVFHPTDSGAGANAAK
jgi:hypothetical protein